MSKRGGWKRRTRAMERFGEGHLMVWQAILINFACCRNSVHAPNDLSGLHNNSKQYVRKKIIAAKSLLPLTRWRPSESRKYRTRRMKEKKFQFSRCRDKLLSKLQVNGLVGGRKTWGCFNFIRDKMQSLLTFAWPHQV
jgi:hypothetical protein